MPDCTKEVLSSIRIEQNLQKRGNSHPRVQRYNLVNNWSSPVLCCSDLRVTEPELSHRFVEQADQECFVSDRSDSRGNDHEDCGLDLTPKLSPVNNRCRSNEPPLRSNCTCLW
ncbi:hypothetical protein AHF37_05410 [Paragonimus kellicotti]|nr:hypothetical protein AHF37_05410 [Paragonimus kellicotti]